jgi:segregation and condensation protein B
VEEYMTEEGRETQESQEIQEVQEIEDVQDVQEVLEIEDVQDAPEVEAVQDVPEAQDSGVQTHDEQRPDASQPPDGFEATVESVIEAVLFASDEPLSEGRLADIVEASAKQVRELVESLNAKYQANNNAFRIEQIAGGYQMLTLNSYNHWLKKLVRERDQTKLSPAALETLAIIAYKQPIIRADIEAVRGVAVGEIIRNLMYKGLVKIAGRAEVLGRPMLYGTTKKFLESFGLNSLKDLPKIEELKKPPA